MAAMLASVAALSGPVYAAGTASLYGSVKLQWNVQPTMNATVHTSYSNAFAYAAPTANLANPAGTCLAAPGGANADLTMDFGNITPSLGATVACTYLNAVGVSVQTNDNNGFQVYEYVDAALPTGINLCAFPNTGASFPMTPGASITQSTRSGVGPAVYAGSCAAGGEAISTVAVGTLHNAGGGPGQPAAAPATAEYESAAAQSGTEMIGSTSAAGTAVLAGEDLQLNVGSTATSGASNAVITLQFVAL